jgi:hypothetical protein
MQKSEIPAASNTTLAQRLYAGDIVVELAKDIRIRSAVGPNARI